MRCALQRRRFREIFLQGKEQNRADSPSVGSTALIGVFRSALESAFPYPGENFSTPQMLLAKKRKKERLEKESFRLFLVVPFFIS